MGKGVIVDELTKGCKITFIILWIIGMLFGFILFLSETAEIGTFANITTWNLNEIISDEKVSYVYKYSNGFIEEGFIEQSKGKKLLSLMSNNDDENIKKELGDVLLHVLFYSKIGEEKATFDIADVADALNSKLIFRHPHIFGSVEVKDAHEVEQNWEQIKLKEKGGNKTVLAGVPSALPAMIKADRIQEKAANVGFDWDDANGAWDKLMEEAAEFKREAEKMDREKMESEMGDLIFSIINVSRLYKINPENALEKTNKKFISRFNYLEQKAISTGRKLNEMTLSEMDELWDEAKSKGL
jgi:XTP/dITP diphosphohydrolase